MKEKGDDPDYINQLVSKDNSSFYYLVDFDNTSEDGNFYECFASGTDSILDIKKIINI